MADAVVAALLKQFLKVFLEKSLEQFLTGTEQESQALAAGFTAAQHRVLAGGQMGVLLLIR